MRCAFPQEALSGTEAAVRELGMQVESLKDEVGALNATLRKLEPARLWREPDELSVQIRGATDRADGAIATTRGALDAQFAIGRRSAWRQTALAVGGLVVVMIAPALVIALAVGALPAG